MGLHDLPADPSVAPGRRHDVHVVMLADNLIVGDSRIQKEAASMAELGWRVTLVGRRARFDGKRRRRFGGVPAHLVYVLQNAGASPQLERSTLLRNPLAYPTLRRERHAKAIADAVVADARFRIEAQKVRGRDRGPRRYTSRARMAWARLRRRVILRRLRATESTRRARDLANGPADRLATAWWRLVRRGDAWQRLDPGIWDWEAAYGPVLDRLQPDLIHANDHRMLHVAARAKVRAAMRGRDVRIVWDAHEWIKELTPWSPRESWLPAQVLLERAFASWADGVATVSDELAEMLREEFALPTTPSVVRNAPLMRTAEAPERTIREVVGLPRETPLIVYSGGIAPVRSVDTAVRALVDLPGVHLAIIARYPETPPASDLSDLAAELGVGDRVHLLPYVPVPQIVPFISSADAGVNTLLHRPNHEISLVTKYYEYAQARLPILVSDVRVMAETTRRHGNGEVFAAGDAADLARAARLVLADPDRYRKAYDDPDLMHRWSWEAQAEVLDALYRRVLEQPHLE